MTLLPFMTDIAVRAGGEKLLIPDGFTDSEFATVVERKQEILAALRPLQMTAGGFLTSLPLALVEAIQDVPWLVVDIETTALTRYSAPTRITKKTPIGPGTWGSYLARHQDAVLNTQPRVRVLTVHHDSLGTYAWDLDILPEHQRKQLFDVVLRGKIIIGHNAGFDLSWMFEVTDARPRFVLDSMLLVRQIKPRVLLRLFRLALNGDDEQQELAVQMIEDKRGKVAATLAYTAACLDLPVPDKSYQAPQNWSITPLSGEHHHYVAGDVDLPLAILRYLIPAVEVEEMPFIIAERYPWYLPFAAATVRLAAAYVKGVPFNIEAANKLKADYQAELEKAVDELLAIQEFAALGAILVDPPLRALLVDPQQGEKQEMKAAFAAHAALHGVEMPLTNAGGISTDQKALMFCGAASLPAWIPYDKVKEAKKAIGQIEQYKRAASFDGRLHSIISCNAISGRMTSSKPNLQNIPRDPRFRELVCAEAGYVIFAVDYSSVELVIAARLAERTIEDVLARVQRGDMETWFMQLVHVGVHAGSRLVAPPEPEPWWTIPWLKQAIPAVAQMVLRRSEQTMASIFRRGLDPHLATAIAMLRQAGLIDTGGLSAIDWLAQQSVEAREELAETWKEWRQKAKAVNFGLLYGMGVATLHRRGISDYNLIWTLEEARQVRNAWFELFPELRLWHFHTKYIASGKMSLGEAAIWDSYQGKLKRPEYERYLFSPTTMVGRPFAVLGDFEQARNYQDQGTGVDILVRAIAMLPEDVAAMMLMPVHDELVFSVPQDAIDEVKCIVMETMVAAGEEVLGNSIPVKVDPQVGPTWREKKKKKIAPILQVEAA
jgi:DNA polymerase family A